MGESKEDFQRYLNAGRHLASPPPGEEIVITGMAGRFANANDVYEFKRYLFNKESMISSDDRRWKNTNPEIPHPTGKINCLEKFDAGFFGIHYREAQNMDPAARQLLERSFEAILDAGYHPDQLKGSHTGVYIGATYSETEKTWLFDRLESPSFAAAGVNRSTLAHWISYHLGLEGRSYIGSTACSTSAQMLNDAYVDLRNGKCEFALVGATNLCLHPMMNLALYRLGILCLDGQCKSFDERANGYVRSEGIAVLFLQKAATARRIYSQIYHVKTNCDGFKPEGIQQPSPVMQQELVTEVYQECNITPEDLDYFEAHATGTHVGDLIEVKSIDDAVCSKRRTPLYIGTTKSILGHTECTSAISAIVKMVIGMENNCLLPNINYKYPRKSLNGIEENRMQIVTEVTPWPTNGKGFAVVNSFGFGGTNGHVLLKKFYRKNNNSGQASDDLPRLICVSGRTQYSVTYILNNLKENKGFNAEFVRMLHEVFRANIVGHKYRGYSILSNTGEISRSCQWFDETRRPLGLALGGLSKELLSMGSALLQFPLFESLVKRIASILSPKQIDIKKIIDSDSIDHPLYGIVSCVAIQVALVDLLKVLNISNDYVVSYSYGELAAGYADSVLTLEQTILASYYIGCYLLTTVGVNNKIKQDTEMLGTDYKDFSRNHSISNRSQDSQQKIKDLELLQNIRRLIPSTSTNVGSSRFSAEHLLENILNPTQINNISHTIKLKSVILIVGSVPIQSKKFTKVHLDNSASNANHKHNTFLYGVGRLYELGYNPSLEKLYPEVTWPVSTNTPMISPLIKWDHTADWFVPRYEIQENLQYGKRVVSFNIEQPEWEFLTGHVLDGRNIVPAMGYLYLIWETFAMVNGVTLAEMNVVFGNVEFHRVTNIPINGNLKFTIFIHKISGKFLVEEQGETVATGIIYQPDSSKDSFVTIMEPISSENVLTTDDIYKVLKLRGYDYKGKFRALKKCNLSATHGKLQWENNWITFIENMLQMLILQKDTKNLYVPVSITKLAINPRKHLNYVKEVGENSILSVNSFKTSRILRSGGIEIQGLTTHSISHSIKTTEEPLLEACKFIPDEAKLTTQESIRVNLQIIIENIENSELHIIEVAADASDQKPLGPLIYDILNDYPVIDNKIFVFSNKPLAVPPLTVEKRELNTETNSCSLVVITQGLSRPKLMKDALVALKNSGFIISRENANFTPDANLVCNIVSIHYTDTETLILIRKFTQMPVPVVIDITNNAQKLNSLKKANEAIKNHQDLLIVARDTLQTDLLGFNGSKDKSKQKITNFFILDNVAEVKTNFCLKQYHKRLNTNIFKDGKWGSYRRFPLKEQKISEYKYVFGATTTKGDLSSICWLQKHSSSTTDLTNNSVQVYYSAINPRDVALATGRINPEIIASNPAERYNVLGTEFSGRNANGKRIMGLVNSGALASVVDNVDPEFTWEVPDELSMEEAVTIPAAYVTAIYSLILIAKLKPNKSILIHPGTISISQAAINIALYHKCKIFVTVHNTEEQVFISKTFCGIPENRIIDVNEFEQNILRQTKGHGVDFILSSPTAKNMQAFVNCLAPGGKLLDIFDLESTSDIIEARLLDKRRSFHRISLKSIMDVSLSTKLNIKSIMAHQVKSGFVKPLKRVVYQYEDIEKAFMHMMSHQHIEKPVIKFRQEERGKFVKCKIKLYNGYSRLYLNSTNSYLIIGELEVFALEVVDFLIQHGAKELILASQNISTSGYQELRIRTWKNYGVIINTLITDFHTEEGCNTAIRKANKLKNIGGIFIIGIIARDISNNPDLTAQVSATRRLDEISRKTCPSLRYFVVFSPIFNDGNSFNSISDNFTGFNLERICEQRKNDGYSALAIRWHDIEEEIPPTDDKEAKNKSKEVSRQKLNAHLRSMETFLEQHEPIVSSVLLPKKEHKQSANISIIDIVKKLIGLKDIKTISTQTKLSELGMDSILAVELKEILENEFQVTFTAHDVRNISFQRLQEMSDEKSKKIETG